MPVKQPDVFIVDDHVDEVSCDGGHGALGHPKVWYGFDGADQVSCGYCGRLFVKERAASLFCDRHGRAA